MPLSGVFLSPGAFVFSLVFATIMSWSAAGVTADDMVLNLNQSLDGVPHLSASQITDDLEFLQTALAKAYAGPDFKRSLSGVLTEPTDSKAFASAWLTSLKK